MQRINAVAQLPQLRGCQGSLTLSVLTNHAIVQVKAQSMPGLTNLDEKEQ